MDIMRTPPHNMQAEQAMLGAMILDRECRDAARTINVDIFYRNAHQVIFETIIEIVTQGKPVDMIILSDSLEKKDFLSDVGGFEYLNDLTTQGIITSNFNHYRRIVEELARKRVLIHASMEAMDLAYDGESSHEDIAVTLKHGIDKSEGYTSETTYMHLKDICQLTFDKLEKDFQEDGTPGMSTGFAGIDKKIRLEKGKIIIVGAAPGMGKTTFAMNLMRNMAFEYTIAVKSLEMPKASLTEKMVLSSANVKSSYFRTQKEKIKPHHWANITRAMGVMSQQNVYMSDKSNQNILQIREELTQLKKDNGLDVVMIDYLQLISPHTKGQTSEQIEATTRELVSIAKDLDVLLIVISSLKRGLDDRANKRPILSDLKGSGILEFSADGVFFVYRDSYYNEPEDSEAEGGDLTEIIIAKNKEGDTGVVRTTYYKEENLFVDRI